MELYACDFPTHEDALAAARDGDKVYFPGSLGSYQAPAEGFQIRRNSPGTYECATDDGLTTCKLHYYALKYKDALDVVSVISNLPSASTLCSGSNEVECP